MSGGVQHVLPEANDVLNQETTKLSNGHTVNVNGVQPSSNGTSATPSPTTGYKLLQRSIDDPRPMKIVVIGAGFSGIIAAIRIPQRVRNVELTVYDKESGIGGTW